MNSKDDKTYDDELMVRAGKLETSISPERDLWPGIEAAITRSSRTAGLRLGGMWAQAAAVVLLVGGSSGITYFAMKAGEDPTVPAVAGPTELVFEPVAGSFGSQYHLGPDYIDARRVLTGNLDQRLERLSPEAREEVLANIETIRKAIEDINLALAEDPDNVLLQQLLIDTYRDELAVMRQVDVISNSSMYRNDI